jgi:hypothetical protein
MSQSNTRSGDIRVLAGEDLTGMEGRLAKLTHDAGVAEVKLPEANDDYAVFVVIEGGADGALVSVRPVESDRNVRVALKGACNPGDALVAADVATPADRGKVRALPATPGTYRVLGIAEAAGVDGQLALVRPALIGQVTVAG